MKAEKAIGYLLVTGAAGVIIPYAILGITFNYPQILRQESGVVLTQFNNGGPSLIITWLAFAMLCLPMLIAYSLIGQHLERKGLQIRWATTIGAISGVVQIIGLLRWVFVVPVLAIEYVSTSSASKKEAIEISFKVIHQFGGVLLGEHVGQLFTIIWTVAISISLVKATIIPAWMAWWGYIASVIYLLAQADLFLTVIPGMPVMPMAGFIGSMLWLLWVLLVGVKFLQVGKVSGL